MGPDTIWVLIPLSSIFCVTGIIYVAIKKQMAETNAKTHNNVDVESLEELKTLKRQIAELRDTTTHYDMSFDSALQRIESRVGHVEGRISTIEQSNQQSVGR